jgi:pyruvate/2-oxoglutarate dehydrogenase complex dihydrolipoamide dehydrogenase (E3) component
MKYEVLVIGSGPAGLEVAVRTAKAGRTTALISASPAGGRATVGSLLPSKVWLHHAHLRPRPFDGHDATTRVSVAAITEAVRSAIGSRIDWATATLQDAGVAIIRGHATLTGSNSVAVVPPAGDGSAPPALEKAPQEIAADWIVLATGSEPVFFPDVRPDGDRIIAPRHTQHLKKLPRSLVMIGGGPTGVEYASVFARLGTEVTLLSYDPVLSQFDREYVGRLTKQLEPLGITFESGVAVEAVSNTGDGVAVTRRDGKTHTSEVAFVATGRAGDLTFLSETGPDLDRTPDGRFIAVGSDGRTSVSSVLACGDVAGPILTANNAILSARRVVATILGGGGAERSSGSGRDGAPGPTAMIEAVYTAPQLAQVGPVQALAAGNRNDVSLIRKSFDASMLSHAHGHGATGTHGEVKIWTDSAGKILGAAALGEHAADLLAPVQVAIRHDISLEELQMDPFAYPGVAEVVTL